MTIKAFDHTYYMKEALKEAQKAFDKDEVPVGAIVVCQDTIIARAHNLTETLHDVTAHAEMQAFTAASDYLGAKYLSGCTLYVTLEPCPMCAGASFWTQVDHVVYGAHDQKRGFSSLGQSLFHPSTTIESGVLEEDCKALLMEFFKRKRK